MSTLRPVVEVASGPAPVHEQLGACVRGAWRSLVVVPTEPGLSSLKLAEAVVDQCNLHTSNRAKLFTAEQLTKGSIASLIADFIAYVDNGGRAVVCIDSPMARRTGVPVAFVVDAAILCVHLGRSTTQNALATIDAIGRDRFIGAVTVAPGVEL